MQTTIFHDIDTRISALPAAMPSLTRPKTKEDSDSVGGCQITLPIEIWLYILDVSGILNITDICNLLVVNRQLREFIVNAPLWIKRYGVHMPSPKHTLHHAWVHQSCHSYERDKDLLFASAGNYSTINGVVERVKRASGCDDGMLYARKSLPIEERGDKGLEAAKRTLLQEAQVLVAARHGHVVKLIEAYFLKGEYDDIRFSIVMECADANLDVYLTSRKISQFADWFGCLIGVTTYIHGLGIQHKNIKPSNILVKDRRVLLSDFGISSVSLPFARKRGVKGYCAPEVEDGSTHGQPADIFSLGAVFLEMLIAHSYPSKREMLEENLTSGGGRSYAESVDQVHWFIGTLKPLLQPDKWCHKVLSCSEKMLQVDPEQRPPADKLNSAWLSLQPSDLPLTPCTCLRSGGQ
jgi:serine/threonine protein kinase